MASRGRDVAIRGHVEGFKREDGNPSWVGLNDARTSSGARSVNVTDCNGLQLSAGDWRLFLYKCERSGGSSHAPGALMVGRSSRQPSLRGLLHLNSYPRRGYGQVGSARRGEGSAIVDARKPNTAAQSSGTSESREPVATVASRYIPASATRMIWCRSAQAAPTTNRSKARQRVSYSAPVLWSLVAA